MNREDMVRGLARKVKWLNKKEARVILRAFLEAIETGLAREGEVRISKFGRFYLTDLDPIWNPNVMHPRPANRAIRFRPSRFLHYSVNQKDSQDGQENPFRTKR